MISSTLRTAFATSLAAITAPALVGAGEIPYAEAPEAVREAFAQHQPRAHADTVTTRSEDGTTLYIIQDPRMDDNHTDTLTAAGQIVACTHDLPLADVPQAVTEGARAAYPQATLVDAQVTHTRGESDQTSYHFHLNTGGTVTCATFSDTGQELPDPHMAGHEHGM